MYFSVTDKLLFVTAVTLFYRQLTDMARLSSQYSSKFIIQYVYCNSLPYFLLFSIFVSFYFASIFFIFIPINLYKRSLAHVFF